MLKKIFKKPWVKWPLIGLLGFIIICLGFYASIYLGLWGKLPTRKELSVLKQSQATQVLDVDGKLIGKYYVFDRQSIHYKDLPQKLIDALIATEDIRFYEHDGVDDQSLVRVFFKTILMQNDSSGGGSTITLQLAKNLFGRKKFGFLGLVVNKLRESIVATRIEEVYSKKEILTLYFNTVPFSDNTYGIESASRKFFNKPAHELTLPEAATLVGSLKANHSYNPRLFPERSQLRRDVVLHQMIKYHFISEAEGNAAMHEKIILDYQYYRANQGVAPYFREKVKQKLQQLLKEKKYQKEDGSSYDVYKDGLKVYTTLNYQLQTAAEEAMQTHMTKLQEIYEKAWGENAPWLKNKKVIEAALKRLPFYRKLKKEGLSKVQIQDSLNAKKERELFDWKEADIRQVSIVDSLKHYLKFLNTGMVSLDPGTGAVRAYIGGIDYRFFKYDHVSQSKRQVGSTFKPFVYTTAIENGMDACTYFPIKAVTYTDVQNWTPKNATKESDDPDRKYSLKTALSHSINTIAVKVLHQAGIKRTIAQAHKMGISSEIEPVPSIALGTCDLGVMEMAKAYTCFVNNSKPVSPYYITKIEDKNGHVIAEFEPKEAGKKAFSDQTRQTLLEMLKGTVNDGTAKRLRTTYGLRNEIAGKTGTTQDNKDGWFIGITPNLVSVIWVGNDDQRIGFSNTAIGQGANSALPIFGLFWQKLNQSEDFNKFTHAHFEETSPEVLASLDCPSIKKPGFFKRLFGSKKTKKKKFKKKKKKGFFSFLKGNKDDD